MLLGRQISVIPPANQPGGVSDRQQAMHPVHVDHAPAHLDVMRAGCNVGVPVCGSVFFDPLVKDRIGILAIVHEGSQPDRMVDARSFPSDPGGVQSKHIGHFQVPVVPVAQTDDLCVGVTVH